jgi:hypothetical protein
MPKRIVGLFDENTHAQQAMQGVILNLGKSSDTRKRVSETTVQEDG